MRRPSCSAAASRAVGRPTRVTVSVSSTGQPSRAQAYDTEEGCGRTCSAPAAQLLGEGPSDPVEHGVAAGQHGGPAPRVGGEQTPHGRLQRRGPGHAQALALRREQAELALTTDQDVGVQEHRAGGVRQSGPAVGTDAHDTHGGRGRRDGGQG